MTNNYTAVISIADIYGSSAPEIDPVYTATGDFRIPVAYDTFLSPKDEVCVLLSGDIKPSGPRIILRKKTLKDVYGTFDPEIPEGYEDAGEFRPGKKGEVVLGVNVLGEIRLILKKKVVEGKPTFKVGDRVLVNGRSPARVLEVKENPELFDTKVVFDMGDYSIGWQASRYMKLAPSTNNRWLIEVESGERPYDIALYASTEGTFARTNLPVISVTPKS